MWFSMGCLCSPLSGVAPGQMIVVVNTSLRFQNNFLHLNKKFGFKIDFYGPFVALFQFFTQSYFTRKL